MAIAYVARYKNEPYVCVCREREREYFSECVPVL
jgi:hypothetical protein